jgi:hypothetical protein
MRQRARYLVAPRERQLHVRAKTPAVRDRGWRGQGCMRQRARYLVAPRERQLHVCGQRVEIRGVGGRRLVVLVHDMQHQRAKRI